MSCMGRVGIPLVFALHAPGSPSSSSAPSSPAASMTEKVKSLPDTDTFVQQLLRIIAKATERQMLADLKEGDRLAGEMLAKIDPDSLRRARECLRDG